MTDAGVWESLWKYASQIPLCHRKTVLVQAEVMFKWFFVKLQQKQLHEAVSKMAHVKQKPYSPLCAPKLGSISLIDILDTKAPLSTQILSLTPSAPWFNSALSWRKARRVWEDTSISPSFKMEFLFSWRRQNVALIRPASLQWSKAITEVNPHETDPSSAWWRQAEIENHPASKSDFHNMSLAKYAFYTKLQKSLISALIFAECKGKARILL